MSKILVCLLSASLFLGAPVWAQQPITSPDGGLATIGAKADPADTTATDTNSVMAFMKGLVKIFADVWDSVGHRIKVDGSGVTQPVSGTVTANLGTTAGLAQDTSVSGLSLAQGAATAGQKAILTECAVTTGAPTYTTGTSNPCSMDTNGNVRITGTLSAATPADTVGSPVALNGLNVTASVALAGQGGAGLFLAAGTLVGTIVPELSDDGGTTWVATNFYDPAANADSASIVFASSNTATTRTILVSGGASHARVRVSAWTSGTGTATVRATATGAGNYAHQAGAWVVTANIGTTNGLALDASVMGLEVAQGSTTIGQKGILGLGAVTTGAPTYTNGQTTPLSLTTSGGIRTDMSSCSGCTLDSTAFTAGTSTSSPIGGVFNDTIVNLTSGQSGAVRLTTDRMMFANVAKIGGVALAFGQAAMAGSIPVVIASNQSALPVTGTFWQATQPVSGTFWQATQPVSQGTPAATTAGWPTIDGTIARTLAAWTSVTTVDTTLAQSVTGYATSTVTVNTTSTMTAGTLNFEVSDDGGTTWFARSACQVSSYNCGTTYALAPNTKTIFDVKVNGFTNFRVRINPVIAGTGTATVAILGQATATEPSVTAGQSNPANLQMTVGAALPTGTNSIGVVQPGNTPNTTPWLFQTVPGTTNGAPSCNLQSAATTNATNCKASAGTIYGYEIINTTATLYYLRLYNLAVAPTCSSATGFVRSIPIPASASGNGVERDISVGEAYGTGVAFCFTGGGSSTDNTNAAAGVYISILYK